MSQATQPWISGEQQKFMSRIGAWFRKNPSLPEETPTNGEDGNSPLMSGPEEPQDHRDDEQGEEVELSTAPEAQPRVTFLRPWGKRDNAMDNLQRGIGALSDLLVSLRDNMERQSQRQEQLLSHLANLPDAMRALPEASRMQTEALQAIHGQIERQTEQQSKLGAILDRLSVADEQQTGTLEALRQTVGSLNDHDQAISQNMQSLGSALASVSGNSQSSAQVLEQLRDNSARRDGELERVLKRQNTRFTTLLTVAIVLSIAALTAVSTFGYLAYEAMSKLK